MKYYVCLNLTPEQIKDLKQSVLDKNTKIKRIIKSVLESSGIIRREKGGD